MYNIRFIENISGRRKTGSFWEPMSYSLLLSKSYSVELNDLFEITYKDYAMTLTGQDD